MTTEKPPVEIVRKSDQLTVGFACGTCGTLSAVQEVVFDKHYRRVVAPTPVDAARIAAERCHGPPPTCACGMPVDRAHYTTCSVCGSRERAEAEADILAKAFARATVLSEWEYGEEPVAAAGATWSDCGADGLFAGGAEALYEYCDDHAKPCPAWAFACSWTKLALDAENVLQAALESGDFHEGAMDDVDVRDLQAHFDAWLEKNPVRTFHEDRSRVVMLSKCALHGVGRAAS